MGIDASTEITILGMAVLTYLTRAAGLFIADHVRRLPPSLERGLQYLPGTIIISLIAPAAMASGTANAVAAMACLGAALFSRNIVVVMATGIATVTLLRNFGHLV